MFLVIKEPIFLHQVNKQTNHFTKLKNEIVTSLEAKL